MLSLMNGLELDRIHLTVAHMVKDEVFGGDGSR